ncbi:MAG: SDR family NAD(P)-dependent oxidoreductase, partial [Acidimicrobiales bacterium]|nr:SDR family NAD(P)-dependent oxidoreductase [Acidimicrobiales bacterium]
MEVRVGSLQGRVAIITGAGRGLGREHARLFAAEGAKVVVNDLGEVAEEVAAEVRAAGGEAIASTHDITDWEGGQGLIAAAVEGFGRLDVLVNNAGILRDRMLVSMSEQE